MSVGVTCAHAAGYGKRSFFLKTATASNVYIQQAKSVGFVGVL